LRLTVQQGKLVPTVSKLEFDRNRGTFGNIIKQIDILQFLPEIRAQIAEKVEKEINGYLTGELQKEMKNFFSTDPRLKKLYQNSKISAKGTTLVLKVTEKKS